MMIVKPHPCIPLNSLKKYKIKLIPVLSDDERGISERINLRITEIKERQCCTHMSVDESRLASTGLMCIAAEANIMSELTHHNDESDKVYLGSYGQQWGWTRRGFCRLVGYSRIAKEAMLMLCYMKGDEGDIPYIHSEFSTCSTVRTRTLEVFTII